MESMIFWMLITIGALLIDILSSSFCFVLLCVGSIIASICSYLGMSIATQVIVFALTNIISIGIGYPWLKKKFKKGFTKTLRMEETYIGKIIEAEKEIGSKSQIKVNGEYWTAINTGIDIKPGEKFIITGIEGIKLLIKKAEGEER